MNEAKRSATVGVTTQKGFEWLFSIREETSEALIKKMEAAEKYFTDNGWTPTKKTFGAKTTLPKAPIKYASKPCPTCGKRLIEGQTKDGRRFLKCETQKYDFKTKTKTGCPYFEWLD